MKRLLSKRQSTGFTIIELLVATVVFSVILVVILAAFIQISRLFYKGVNMTNTQNDAQNLTKSVENDIQFTSTSPDNFSVDYNTASFTNTFSSYSNSLHSGSFCVGGHHYSYYFGNQVGSASNAGIYRENFSSSCPTAANTNAEQILGGGIQLNAIGMNCTAGSGRCIFNVHIVFYGGTHDGLFASNNPQFTSNPWLAPDAECTGALTSSQYCAATDYKRTVLQ